MHRAHCPIGIDIGGGADSGGELLIRQHSDHILPDEYHLHRAGRQ